LTRWHPEAVHPAHEEFADDVALLLDGLGESSAIVIGHDWGASEYRLNTNVQFEECDDYPIPAGKILFVTNLIADFDMPATSSGTAAVRFTPVGADSSLRAPLPVQQGGRTATNDLVGESNVLGYRVPAS
jgi:hypothetical protein